MPIIGGSFTAINDKGNGLGLTIVRRIAELHGATLELANRTDGGFAATLTWPVPPPAP